jgi:hypothetical protein
MMTQKQVPIKVLHECDFGIAQTAQTRVAQTVEFAFVAVDGLAQQMKPRKLDSLRYPGPAGHFYEYAKVGRTLIKPTAYP